MTTVTATPDPAAGSVRLELNDAPSPGGPVYSGDAEAGTIDGWGGVGGVTVTNVTSAAGGQLKPPAGSRAWRAYFPSGAGVGAGVQRTVSGLVPGQRYRAAATVVRDWNVGHLALGVVGQGQGEPTYRIDAFQPETVAHEWVATSTSHVVQLLQVMGNLDPYAEALWDLVTVAPVPVAPTIITRTDANGTARVRLREGQEPLAGYLGVTDHEPALSGLVRYDVLDGNGASLSVSVDLGGVTPPRLDVPVFPSLGVALELVTDYSAAYPAGGSVHQVVEGAYPTAVLAPLRARSGRLVLLCRDHAAALQVVGCYSRGQVVMLRQASHAGMDLYHVAEGPSAVMVSPDPQPASPRRWVVEVTYQEVARPDTPQLGVWGWSYADVAHRFDSYAAVRSAFDSYADLAAGPDVP